MTLQEAKDQIAEKYGYCHWSDMTSSMLLNEYKQLSKRHDEAAELYSRSKWNEACEAQKQMIWDDLNLHVKRRAIDGLMSSLWFWVLLVYSAFVFGFWLMQKLFVSA